MVSRLSKNRKKRGHVSAGHGRVGKHRKTPGGRGNAGGEHHHRIMMNKYHPGFYCKNGMRQFRTLKNRDFCETINVEKLWSLVPEEIREAATSEQVPIIDCAKAGFFKVLGKGIIIDKPMVVRARFFSKTAEEKIQKAGG
ncbi:hypothetical protein P9112_013745, partial [Eukaryota sp. TZLM1-RC]